MSLKKKLGMGIGTAILGLSLVGGGTFAYFSDTAVSENTFAAGTLDLAINPEVLVDVDNLKPGDWMPRTFELENNGSLDISKVLLETEYTVQGNDNFGEHIRVNFMKNNDKSGLFLDKNIIEQKTLAELRNMTPDAVEELWFNILGFGEDGGLEAGDTDNLNVVFEFVDNGQDQNEFQGAKLNLKWTFNAEQTAGEER